MFDYREIAILQQRMLIAPPPLGLLGLMSDLPSADICKYLSAYILISYFTKYLERTLSLGNSLKIFMSKS